MTENVTPAPADTEPVEGAKQQPAQTTTEPAANQAENTQPEQPTLTEEQIKEYQSYKKFLDANGGFDKVKQRISSPEKQPEAPATPQQPTQPAQPTQPNNVPEGMMSLEAMAVKTYWDSLARSEKYASLADQLRDGSLMKEMESSAFGIKTLVDGGINDRQIRAYLDMKLTAAPQQTSTEPTNTPTVDYVPIDNVTTYEDAMKIFTQNHELKAKGLALHPQTEAANKIIKEHYAKK